MSWQNHFSSSQLWIIFLLSFLGGVFLRSFAAVPIYIIYETGGIALMFLGISFYQKKYLLGFFLFLGLLGGIWRFQIAEGQIAKNPLKNYFSQEVSVQGWVCQEPKVSSQQELILCLSSVKNFSGSQKVFQPIFLRTGLFPTYHYGEKLKAIGLLHPIQTEGRSASSFLRQGIIASISYPYLQILKGERGFWLKRLALQFKGRLKKIINQSFSNAGAAFLKAIFLGDRSDMSFLFRNQLAAIGLIHLIAVSGLHLVILTSLFLVLAKHLKINHTWTLSFALIFLWLFVLLVGGRPSILRAAIMSSLLLVGEFVHRPALSLRSLILAAAILLLANPFSLRMDVGFQLSFLAVLGIIWLKPFMATKRKQSVTLDLIETTFAAQILVWPLLLYHFGQASIISPLSNLLVTPFLPLLFGLGFSFLFLEFCFPGLILLGQFFLGPLVWYFLTIIHLLSSLPHILLSYSLPGWGLALIYFPLLVFFFFRDPLRLFSTRHVPFQISGRW